MSRFLPRQEMLVFLSMVSLTLGLMNYYIYIWFQRAFGWPRFSWLALLACVFLTALPIAERIADRSEMQILSRIIAIPAFVWLLTMMWFFCGGLAAETWNLIVRIVALASGRSPQLLIRPGALIIFIACWSAAAIAWGLIEASCIRVNTVNLFTPKLPPDSKPVRIVQLSDLHLCGYISESKVRRVIDLVTAARPDMLVMTGDVLDSLKPGTAAKLLQFSTVNAPLGKFASLGNHEFYTGPEESASLLTKAGFVVLRGSAREVKLGDGTNSMIIAGVDDNQFAGSGGIMSNEDAALPPAGQKDYVVLLKHKPSIAALSAGRFDLQLSGHTHGGQIFPFLIPVRLTHHYFSGLYRTPDQACIYVNRGAGTWGPPIRLFAPPEITLITVSGKPAD